MANPASTGKRSHHLTLIQVKHIHDISPRLRCITFHGDALRHYPADRHGAHIKLFIPQQGQQIPTLPTFGERGPVWPEGEIRPIVRTYTIRAVRQEEAELDIVFAMHDHAGPAVSFARQAKTGDYIGITSPGGPHPMLPPAAAYYLAGDPSALPAIAALLENLPDDAQGHAVIRVDSSADILDLVKPDRITLHWVVGGTEATDEAINRFRALPHQENAERAFYWLAGEDQLVVQLRRYVRRECGCERNQLYAVPYWREGLNEEAYHRKRHDIMDNPDD
ncbi:siderophore-interacting protein [Brenneria roseae subsp. americana]|uniref:Siderophore-interacting protein n=1 Tax=Brenneria roseae subsp. americana TaxID=1508507 RepID=A0A2U1TTW0_9GAMM|nr:siderophore-interacting protein [Brenneria roseae]PWC12830.1 siderophore-interacting protein [Brenneria roseae subsp. americana]